MSTPVVYVREVDQTFEASPDGIEAFADFIKERMRVMADNGIVAGVQNYMDLWNTYVATFQGALADPFPGLSEIQHHLDNRYPVQLARAKERAAPKTTPADEAEAGSAAPSSAPSNALVTRPAVTVEPEPLPGTADPRPALRLDLDNRAVRWGALGLGVGLGLWFLFGRE